MNAQFFTQPTVPYLPLQGEMFAQQHLSPLRIEAVMLLYRSGWPLKRVLRLCAQRLNQVDNAVHAFGPTPEWAPANAGQPPQIVLQMPAEAARLPDAQELWRLLRLTLGQTLYSITYPLVERGADVTLDHLEMETRSLLGMLFYLAGLDGVDRGGEMAGARVEERGGVSGRQRDPGGLRGVGVAMSWSRRATGRCAWRSLMSMAATLIEPRRVQRVVGYPW